MQNLPLYQLPQIWLTEICNVATSLYYTLLQEIIHRLSLHQRSLWKTSLLHDIALIPSYEDLPKGNAKRYVQSRNVFLGQVDIWKYLGTSEFCPYSQMVCPANLVIISSCNFNEMGCSEMRGPAHPIQWHSVSLWWPLSSLKFTRLSWHLVTSTSWKWVKLTWNKLLPLSNPPK